MRRILIIVAFVTAGCATQQQPAARFASMEQAVTAGLMQDDAHRFPAEILPALAACGGKSVVEDIPAADQAKMLEWANSRRGDGQTDVLFVKWIGFSILHGKIKKPTLGDPSTYANGKLYFEDGTLVPAAAVSASEQDAQARVRRNFEKNCPNLLKQYPDFFK